MPVWLQILSLIVTTFLSIVTTIFIWRQHKLEQLKIKISSYERRIYIYNEIREYLEDAISHRKEKVDSNTTLGILRQEAKFIFDNNKIFDFIVEITNVGHRVVTLKNILDNTNLNKEERKEYAEKWRDAWDYLEDQFRVLDELFKPYLKISEQNPDNNP